MENYFSWEEISEVLISSRHFKTFALSDTIPQMVDRDPKRTSLQVETTKAIGSIESGSQEAILKDWFLRRLLMQIGYETVSGKVREGFKLLTPEETVLFF